MRLGVEGNLYLVPLHNFLKLLRSFPQSRKFPGIIFPFSSFSLKIVYFLRFPRIMRFIFFFLLATFEMKHESKKNSLSRNFSIFSPRILKKRGYRIGFHFPPPIKIYDALKIGIYVDAGVRCIALVTFGTLKKKIGLFVCFFFPPQRDLVK